MAFDVEGARKAGYTDAEIASALAQRAGFDLKGAKSAGYSDGEVIAKLSAAVKPVAVIPGQEGEAARIAAAKAAPKPGIVDTAIGTGETALTAVTGATGGALGLIGGTLKGLAEQILSGKFGTPEAANLVERAAMEGSQALTYAPRTQSGQEQTAALGKAMQQMVPIMGAAPGVPMPAGALEAPAMMARDAAAVVANKAAGIPPALRTMAGKVAQKVTGEADLPTPGTMGSVGAAGTDIAAQRRALAESMPAPIKLTKGQASRDPAQLKFEVETAKIPDAGAPLRERLVAQNEAILRNFDIWADQTGAEAPSLRTVGAAVDKALVAKAARDKAEIRVKYKAAEKAGELEAPVTLNGVVNHLNESAPDAATAPLLDVARARAVRLGIAAEGPDGNLVPQPVPLKIAETYRQAVSRATDFEPTNVRQATIIKGLVDEATDGLGGNLYKEARASRARYAQQYESHAVISKLLNNKRGTADRQVALEDVFNHSILKGSLDDVRTVRKVLQTGGEDGKQAWRELQGATVRHIQEQATKGIATDGAGNRVLSPASLERVIRDLDADGKLEFVFGRKGAQQMRDISELAKVAKTVPPEAAVNFSNTAATLLGGLADIAGYGMTGAPVPIVTLGRLTLKYVKDAQLRRRINDALQEVNKRQAPGRNQPIPQSAPGASQSLH